MTTYLPTLSEFRALRNRFQRERRNIAYPALIAQESALKRKIHLYRKAYDSMGKKETKSLAWAELAKALHHNHRRDTVYSKMLELSWKQQDISGQLAVIEEAA